MTSPLAFASMVSLTALALTLAGCGDSTASTTATATQDTSSSTSGGPTTTEVAPTTSSSSTTDAEPTSAGETTGTASTTEAVSATETTSATTTTTTTDTTSTTDTSSTTGGETEGPAKACLDADFPVAVAPCGAGQGSCATIRDELVSATPSYRNDMPAIALDGDCEPVVLYSEAVGGYHGFLAERTGPATWAAAPTPMPVATASIESEPDLGATWAMVDDGAFGVTLWQHAAGQWTQEASMPGQNHLRAAQLVRVPAGPLHVGHVDDGFAAYHETYLDGDWTKGQVAAQSEIHVRLAVGPDYVARLIAWSSADAQTWKLRYVHQKIDEEVTPLGSDLLQRPHTSLALTGPESTPWVLLARKLADQQHHEVVLAHRTGENAWTLETLAAEDPDEELCSGSPTMPGQTCDYDYLRLYPLALASGADEVRALYLAIHHQGTYTAECEPQPFPECIWTAPVDASTSELRVAWPGSLPAEHQVAATDVFTDRATARVDTTGAIHVALYDQPPTAFDAKVRYLMIGE